MRFDTHTHTNHSPCSAMSPRELVDAAEAALDTVVVCDHNEIDGALEAREICRRESRQLIVELGIELSTPFGEFGAKFLSEKEAGQFMSIRNERGRFAFAEAVDLVSEIRSDASSRMLVDLHHPYDHVNPKRGFNFDALLRSGIFKDMDELMGFFDFTEMNTASMQKSEPRAALELAKKYNKPIVCATDSHFPPQIGRYYTETDHTDARQAILDDSDLVLPSLEEVSYWRSRMYRIASGALKKIRS